MNTKFVVSQPGDPEHLKLAQNVHKHNVGVALSTPQLLVLQFAKLANYWGDQLSPDWGGDYVEHRNLFKVRVGLLRFFADVSPLCVTGADRWIHRINPESPWSVDNVVVRQHPSNDLGRPFEPYIGARKGIVTLAQASRMLCIDPVTLLQLKLRLIMDDEVVAQALRRMLLPRGKWSKVRLSPGTPGKSIIL